MVIYEDPEILFQLLVCAFQLAISLRVICRTDVLHNSQSLAEFSGENGSETRVTIGDDAVR